jgi:adenine phosphoribosyltransferase
MIVNGMERKDDEFYELHIALNQISAEVLRSDSLDIAAFILFGDVELAECCAKALLEKVPEFDYIITPEAKSIPLAYEMSKQSGKKYRCQKRR